MRALISSRKIALAVRRLARQIDAACRRAGTRELTVVCVMDGAFIFTADLVRALRTPTRVVFAKATSYQGTRRRATRLHPLPESLRGKAILIADTIYDTGRTIARVSRQARLLSPRVWLAVLVEKQGQAAVPPDRQAERVFVGIRLAGDPFLIGYGLDVSGRYRHLPDILVHTAATAADGPGRRK